MAPESGDEHVLQLTRYFFAVVDRDESLRCRRGTFQWRQVVNEHTQQPGNAFFSIDQVVAQTGYGTFNGALPIHQKFALTFIPPRSPVHATKV